MANLAEPLVARRLVAGRVTAERDSDRLRAEVRTRWRAVGHGGYPLWCAIVVACPLCALALPPALRRLRRTFRSVSPE
jgi:hypothetical protein